MPSFGDLWGMLSVLSTRILKKSQCVTGALHPQQEIVHAGDAEVFTGPLSEYPDG